MNKKKIFKILGLIIAIIIFAFFIGFVGYKIYDNIHTKNLSNKIWLKKHVDIKENKKLGTNIYSVSKSRDIDIYTSNYQRVIQEKIDELLKQEIDLDDNIIIIYNPYGTNLLSFNIYFSYAEDVEITYKVSVNKKNIPDFTRKLNTTSDNHKDNFYQYQLVGFVPGYINTLQLEVKSKDGTIIKKKIKLDLTDIDCNSQTKLKVTNGVSNKELSDGLYAILGNDSDYQDYVSLYDNDGILRSEIPIIGYRAHAILFRNNKMYFSISQTKIAEVNNLGMVKQVYRTGKYQLHHDYTFDNDGNLLVLANNTKKSTEEDCIIKIDLNTKKVEELIDFEDIFSSYVETCTLDTESTRDEGEDGLDWLHLNSIEYVDGSVILSSRETSSIIKVSNIEENPKLEYILSDKKIWENTDFKDYVYDKIGDFKIHAGQHSVRYQESDDSNIYYLTFYNNNYGKANSQPSFDYNTIGINNDNAFEGDKSYYYVYKVDEKAKTFELIDSFDILYSGIVSSVLKMDNGNIVIDSGTKGIFFEYDSEHELIRKFKINLNKYMVYRVLKYDFNNFLFQI